ncbi:MAG: hypothetical protein KAQ98_04815 [Bacteriovoracaceae bacterium]|nr:hypothetical protein [Bacteriovoracaceae bacterium]
MRKLIIALCVLFCSVSFASDYFGCDTGALDYAAKMASAKYNLCAETLKSNAEVEMQEWNETYGQGSFVVTFYNTKLPYGLVEYFVAIILWDDYSCEVNEGDSYEI